MTKIGRSQQFAKIILLVFGLGMLSVHVSFACRAGGKYLGDKKGQIGHAPDYGKAFPQNKVNRIDIVIKPSDWKKLIAEMETHFGKFGSVPSGMPPPPPELRDSLHVRNEKGFPGMPPDKRQGFMPLPPFLHNGRDSFKMEFPPNGKMMPPPAGKMFSGTYVPCSLCFEGKEWRGVGIRVKGNSSLFSCWARGIKKWPLRVDFDKFRDSIPEIRNQQFFGFNELSFANNTNDNSFMREKITADMFREAGVKAPRTAFYQVYVDFGEGPIYFGLYTAVEVVNDTMLKDQFSNASGNCYKPEGEGARFAAGTFDTISFKKETNKKLADWSDVKKLYQILNSDIRRSNIISWKADLESVFDVQGFINWLAVNTAIQNWDTYGRMAHNYYLYADPSTNKIVWIPWDNNEALRAGGMGALSLSLSEVTDDWPLIRYLMDVPEYSARYKAALKSFVEKVFGPQYMGATYQHYYDLIYPYVMQEQKEYSFLSSKDDFQKALMELKKHAETRAQEVNFFLK